MGAGQVLHRSHELLWGNLKKTEKGDCISGNAVISFLHQQDSLESLRKERRRCKAANPSISQAKGQSSAAVFRVSPERSPAFRKPHFCGFLCFQMRPAGM